MMRSIGIQLTLMLGLFLSAQALAGVKFESFDEDPGWLIGCCLRGWLAAWRLWLARTAGCLAGWPAFLASDRVIPNKLCVCCVGSY